MEKRLLTTLLLLFSPLSLASDFIFIAEPFFPNTTCGNNIVNATYTLKNDEHAGITITYTQITQEDSFPPELLMIDFGPLTTCVIGETLPAQSTCNINLIVNPNAGCSDNFFSADVKRFLHVGINTWEQEVSASPIIFHYQTSDPDPGPGPDPGPADGFVILGNTVRNNLGVSSIIGNMGNRGGGMTGSFDVEGHVYGPSAPEVINAQTKFEQLYDEFVTNLVLAGCRERYDLDSSDIVQSAYYCLSTNTGLDYVNVDNHIKLSGKGDFVFFVQDHDLRIGSNTHMTYLDGATPQKLYWVLTDSAYEILIASGARLDGTVLSQGNIQTSANGPSPAAINGIFWSQGDIDLYGDTVAIHFE